MKPLFYKLGKNIVDSFRGYNFIYHLFAILITYILVTSGLDWKYFQVFAGSNLSNILFSAAIIGFFIPVIVSVVLLIFGKIKKSTRLLNTGFALGQVAFIGWFISSSYKFFTGRFAPPLNHLNNVLIDTSKIFHFGLFRDGIFWGWPSSHTTIAFAMALVMWQLYPKNKIIKILSLVYALYIGIGVSMTIHWFSDFIAGAIIGTVIGIVVGKAFKEKN